MLRFRCIALKNIKRWQFWHLQLFVLVLGSSSVVTSDVTDHMTDARHVRLPTTNEEFPGVNNNEGNTLRSMDNLNHIHKVGLKEFHEY